MNVVQSDNCQNVLPKLNIQYVYIKGINSNFNSLANAPNGVSLL